MPGVMMLSRDLKRVPLDFDWPLNKVWDGYLMQETFHDGPCPTCSVYSARNGGAGMGYTAEAWQMQQTWWEHIVGTGNAWSDKLGQAEIDWLYENDEHFWAKVVREDGTERGWHWEKMPKPAAAEVNAAQRERRISEPVSQYKAIEVRCRLLGIETTCQTCGGHGVIYPPGGLEREEAWEATDPPTGEGYQLWESVSEGSPTSPVFDNVRALAEWLSANDTSILRGKSIEDWLSILGGEVLGTDISTGALV